MSTDEFQLALVQLGFTADQLADTFHFEGEKRDLIRRCASGEAVVPPDIVSGIDNLILQRGWLGNRVTAG